MISSRARAVPLGAMTLTLVSLALCLPSAGGCGSYKSPGDKLRDAAWHFNESVRWGRFTAAAEALPASRRGPWLKAMEGTAGALRVLEFDMTPVRVGDKRALIQVDLSYVRASDPVVRRQRRQQIWRYDDGRWTLEVDRQVELHPVAPAAAPSQLPDFVADAPQPGAPPASRAPQPTNTEGAP